MKMKMKMKMETKMEVKNLMKSKMMNAQKMTLLLYSLIFFGSGQLCFATDGYLQNYFQIDKNVRGLIMEHLSFNDITTMGREFFKEKDRSPFMIHDLKKWATIKTKKVEQMMARESDIESGVEFLYQKGWFDRSPDPDKPNPYYISEDFYLSDFITQEAWVEVMNKNPSTFPNKLPCPKDEIFYKGIKICKGWAVTDVSLYDARVFIHILNLGSPDTIFYDLPDTAQFEYAERGGVHVDNLADIKLTNTGRFGSIDLKDDENGLNEFKKRIPWTGEGRQYWNAGAGPTKKIKNAFPNPQGAQDLHGHLYTWMKDKVGVSGNKNSERRKIKSWGLDWELESEIAVNKWRKNEQGGVEPLRRSLRGSSWSSYSSYLRAGDDSGDCPDYRDRIVGVRFLRTFF